jgi:hypothetical protein
MFDKILRFLFNPPQSPLVVSPQEPANDIEARCDQIALDVETVNAEGTRVYGARFSGIRRGALAAVADVEAFEARYGGRLPEEYRAFLVRVGNGIADGYLVLVNTLDDELYFDGRLVNADFLSASFPFDAAFSPFPKYDGEPYSAPGTLLLTNAGCGMYVFMVVSGANAGQIWFDHLVDGHGLVPGGQSFLDWIEAMIKEKSTSLRAGKVFNLKRANGEQMVCIA